MLVSPLPAGERVASASLVRGPVNLIEALAPSPAFARLRLCSGTLSPEGRGKARVWLRPKYTAYAA